MKRAGVASRLLWATLAVGVWGGEPPRGQAVDHAGGAMARIAAQVPAHIFISAPMMVTVDLKGTQLGGRARPLACCRPAGPAP